MKLAAECIPKGTRRCWAERLVLLGKAETFPFGNGQHISSRRLRVLYWLLWNIDLSLIPIALNLGCVFISNCSLTKSVTFFTTIVRKVYKTFSLWDMPLTKWPEKHQEWPSWRVVPHRSRCHLTTYITTHHRDGESLFFSCNQIKNNYNDKFVTSSEKPNDGPPCLIIGMHCLLRSWSAGGQ